MKKALLQLCVFTVVTMMLLAFGVASANAGDLEECPEIWYRWEDCQRANGPSARFNNNRIAKIGAYSEAVNNATVSRSAANDAAALKLVENLKDSSTKDKALKNYQNALKNSDEKWIHTEQKAYDALIRGIRRDYRKALTERANEYRISRKTISCSFHLHIDAKKRPWGSQKRSGVGGSLRHPRIEEGEDFRLEWEIADESVYNPDAHHLSGVFSSKRVTRVDDNQYVGIDFFFEVMHPTANRTYREADGAPWCTFKLTEETCVEQARRDMGGMTDEQLETCQTLLDQVRFQRRTLEKQQ